MRFLFVEEITRIAGDRIEGRRAFALDEPLRYRRLGGESEIAPGAISEAIGQLASWLCLQRNEFTARPVFLFADKIRILGPVQAGSDVNLVADILEMNQETFRFSGHAEVEGIKIAAVEQCSGYFMPLGELEDPEVTRARFAALTTGGLKLEGSGGTPYAFDQLAGETLALAPKESIHTKKTFDPAETFYKDHFPRFPVTPIVMLNEMIGSATTRMMQLSGAKRLEVRELSGIKIRNFVKPGESCETLVKVVGERQDGATTLVETIAELVKDGKKILRGNYHYRLTEAP